MRALDITMAVVVGGLFATGLLLMLQRSLTRALLGFIVLGHGTNLLLLVAGGPPGDPPVLSEESAGDRLADPLPQAMALTAIVITFGLTTFLLGLAYRAWRLSGHDEVRDDVEDRSIGTVREREDAWAAAAVGAEAEGAPSEERPGEGRPGEEGRRPGREDGRERRDGREGGPE